MRCSYRLPRAVIVSTLRKVVGLGTVEVEDLNEVSMALDWHEQGLDFADALHLAGSGKAGRFATFDQNMVNRAGTLQPMEIIAV